MSSGTELPRDATVAVSAVSRQPFARWTWPLSLAAVLLIGLGMGMFTSGWFDSGPSDVAEVVQPIQQNEEVAHVTGSLNCRWQGQPNQDVIGFGSALFAGQHLDLVEGVAEITFNSGARMLLQAPAELDVVAG